jgi:uncharacterized protein (DUF433 family)
LLYRIALDIASGNFNCTDNTELKLKYLPNENSKSLSLASQEVEDSAEEIAARERTLLIDKLKKRLETKYHSSDKALIPLLQNYKKPLESIEDAVDFIEWIRKTRKVKNSTLQRYLNTLKVISPLFQKIQIKSERLPLSKPFSAEEVRAIINWFENRIRVEDIVIWHERMGLSPDEIVSQYPTITLADVYAALAYYHDHFDEIRRQILQDEEFARDMQAKTPSLVQQKLMQRDASEDSISLG